jgi:hypothetical protein
VPHRPWPIFFVFLFWTSSFWVIFPYLGAINVHFRHLKPFNSSRCRPRDQCGISGPSPLASLQGQRVALRACGLAAIILYSHCHGIKGRSSRISPHCLLSPHTTNEKTPAFLSSQPSACNHQCSSLACLHHPLSSGSLCLAFSRGTWIRLRRSSMNTFRTDHKLSPNICLGHCLTLRPNHRLYHTMLPVQTHPG